MSSGGAKSELGYFFRNFFSFDIKLSFSFFDKISASRALYSEQNGVISKYLRFLYLNQEKVLSLKMKELNIFNDYLLLNLLKLLQILKSKIKTLKV